MRRSAVVLGTLLTGSVILAAASDAFGHAHMTYPMRRANCQSGDDASCKPAMGAGPCGGTPNPAVTPTIFFVGSSYTLTWAETIQHISTYRFNLSTNGEASQAAFDAFPVMPDGTVPDGTGPANYQFVWTVPDTANCNPCVMQLIQDMDAVPGDLANPYYNCADVRILAAGAATPTPENPTPTPTPNPGNPNDPVEVDAYGSCAIGTRQTAAGFVATALVLWASVFVRRRRKSE